MFVFICVQLPNPLFTNAKDNDFLKENKGRTLILQLFFLFIQYKNPKKSTRDKHQQIFRENVIFNEWLLLHSYRIFPLREFLDIVAETTCKIEEVKLRGFF